MNELMLAQIKAFMLGGNWWVPLIILLALGISLYSWHLIYRFSSRWAMKTTNKLDDLAIHSLKRPVYVVLMLCGFTLLLDYFLSPFLSFFEKPGRILSYILLGGLLWFCLNFASNLEKFLIQARPSSKQGDKESAPKARFLDTPTLFFLSKFLQASIIIVFILTLLSMLGVSISGLLAFGGISGIIVGLAVRETIANFLSGLLIFWDRPFVVGDWIRCPSIDLEGVVEEINWRVTKIRTFERRPVYVPNSMFMNHFLENPQRMTHRRLNERFGIRYEDLEKLPHILEDIRLMIDKHQRTDTAENWVARFDEYGESSLIFFVTVVTPATDWTEFHRIKEEILFKVADIVHKHGAQFAYPTRRIITETAQEDASKKT